MKTLLFKTKSKIKTHEFYGPRTFDELMKHLDWVIDNTVEIINDESGVRVIEQMIGALQNKLKLVTFDLD